MKKTHIEGVKHYLYISIAVMIPLLIFSGIAFIEFEKLFGDSKIENRDAGLKLTIESYENQIYNNQNDVYNIAIAKACKDADYKMSCVTNALKKLNIKYIDHYIPPYYTTTEALEKGWVCRDYAVNLCSIIRLMDQSCYVVYTDGHAVSLVQFRGEYQVNNKTYEYKNYCITDISGTQFCW